MIRSLAVFILAAAVSAQALTLEALQPVTTQAAFGAVSDVQTLPVGPLPGTALIQAYAGNWPNRALAEAFLDTSASDTRLRLHVSAYCDIDATMAASTSAGVELDLLLHVDLPPQTSVVFSLISTQSTVAGSLTPLLEVDIGNDGSNEWSQFGNNLSVFRTVGATPLPVRVRVDLETLVVGPAGVSAFIDVTPSKTRAFTYVAGCSTGASVAGRFDGGVQVESSSPRFVVFGLQPQPLLLPTNPFLPGSPCLVIPAPDLVAFMPTGGFVLQIPPAVRPISLWAQSIQFSTATGMPTTGTAYSVQAF